MFKIIVLLLILVVAVPLCFRSWQRASARSHPKRSSVVRAAAKPAFSAVTIDEGANCCQAVQAVSGQVFPANTAPQLPLPECGVASCSCRYAHVKDRREGERRSPVLVLQEQFTRPEQWANRGVRGRRKDDIDEAKRAEKVLKDALHQP